MLTYILTPTGYRIQSNGVDWMVQENEYATVYHGSTIEERAKNHLKELTCTLNAEEEKV